VAEAQLLSPHAKNAWTAPSNHLDFGAMTQAEFCQAMCLVRIADDRADLGHLSGSQAAEGDQIMHGFFHP